MPACLKCLLIITTISLHHRKYFFLKISHPFHDFLFFPIILSFLGFLCLFRNRVIWLIGHVSTIIWVERYFKLASIRCWSWLPQHLLFIYVLTISILPPRRSYHFILLELRNISDLLLAVLLFWLTSWVEA